MNIVEFAESILGHELLDYQKEYLLRMHITK